LRQKRSIYCLNNITIRLSLGKVLVHGPVSSLQFVLVGCESPLHREAALGPRQLPVDEVGVVLPALVLLHLLLLFPPVLHHPGRPLLVPPVCVGHHLRQLGLLLLLCHWLLSRDLG